MYSAVDVLIASTAPTRDAVYRFRQTVSDRVSVDILPNTLPKTVGLQDTLDPLAVLFSAFEPSTGRLIGSVRTNLLRDGAVPLYPQLYQLGDLTSTSWNCSAITTCWTLEPPLDFCADSKRAAVATSLAWNLYDFLLEIRICHDFLDCADQHVSFFEYLGYKHVRSIEHPHRGPSNLMRLDIYDWAHLATVKSPFLSLARG